MQHADKNGIYRPIGGNAIRLLSIGQALPNEPIECALITVDDLDDAPEFEAISYVWGVKQSPNPIACNGAKKVVTQNLEDALRYLRPLPSSAPFWTRKHALHSSQHAWRDFGHNRYEQDASSTPPQMLLWIDALCINQDDVVEKANQVKLMGQIYQRASQVKIWLGKPSYNVPVVLNFINQALRNVGEDHLDDVLAYRPLDDREYKNRTHGLPRPSNEIWRILRSFFLDPWFERVWIVQEAVLARKAVVIIGDWHMDWAAVGHAAAWYNVRGYSLPLALTEPTARETDLVPAASAAALWSVHAMEGKRAPLLYLLKEFRSRRATLAVDKLYATLGIAEETANAAQDGWHMLLEPDYDAKTVEEVYRDAAMFLIVHHCSLLVLSQVDRHPSESPGWPSWVPDWSRPKMSSDISVTPGPQGCGASGTVPLSMGVAEDIKRGLSLEGLLVDVVASCTNKLESPGSGNVVYEEEQVFISDAWRLASSQQGGADCKSSVREQMPRRFVEALTAGTKELSSEASSWFQKYLGHELGVGGSKWSWMSRADPIPFNHAFVRACTDRRFFVTQGGLMGIGPANMDEEAVIVILFGGTMPFVMRKQGQRYRLVGDCYIPGLMNGEAMTSEGLSSQRRGYFEII